MSGGRRVKDSVLEAYLVDALAADARAGVEAALAASEADRARLEELRADSAAFLVQHPPGPLVARYEAERRSQGWRRRFFVLAPALAAASIVAFLVWPKSVVDDPFTVKGSVVLRLHRKTPQGSAPVRADERLRAGDVVLFEVKAPASGYVGVLGRDGRGAVTVYHPYGGTSAAPYDPARPVLDTAIMLDDAPGREDLYALFSKASFPLDGAVAALRAGEPLDRRLPPGVQVGHLELLEREAASPENPRENPPNVPHEGDAPGPGSPTNP